MRHPCFQQAGSILEKLRQFHRLHETSLEQLLAELETAVEQLPGSTRRREAEIVAGVLEQQTNRQRGASAIGDVLPAVLARLNLKTTKESENRDRS